VEGPLLGWLVYH